MLSWLEFQLEDDLLTFSYFVAFSEYPKFKKKSAVTLELEFKSTPHFGI